MHTANLQAFHDCLQLDASATSSFNDKSFKSFIVNSINFGSVRTITITYKNLSGSTSTVVLNVVRNTSDGRIYIVNESGLEILTITDNTTSLTPASGELLITLLN
jgi:hypothetical protein